MKESRIIKDMFAYFCPGGHLHALEGRARGKGIKHCLADSRKRFAYRLCSQGSLLLCLLVQYAKGMQQ